MKDIASSCWMCSRRRWQARRFRLQRIKPHFS
ncbi:MAG: hypothetical protein EYC68_20100 [Chloroflexota bacterium]|nr:MAG: hypothetical protein EYC68_20100 [Chloroflexota bacterium]